MNTPLPPTAPTAERPLIGVARYSLIALATAMVALFYVYCALAVALIGYILVVEIFFLIAAARVGAASFMARPIEAQLQLAGFIFRSLNLQRSVEYRLPVQREDAPALFDLVARIAQSVNVDAPDEIALEMTPNAWVQLRGYRTGRGRSILGLGFDFFATLSQRELEAVIAHEMAHAKLVQRGYKGWLMKGVARTGQLAGALTGLSEGHRAEKRRFYTAYALAKGARLLARSGTRFVAAYARQDEFAADILAAQVTSAASCRSALLLTYVVGNKSTALTWHDRVVSSQRDASFCAWLRGRLWPSDEAERAELEQRAMREPRGEFDTHPSLADRLAALPKASTSSAAASPALDLLDAADDLAGRAIGLFERIWDDEQQKESSRLRK